ncbi:MAG: lysylphosphatidylglycerol synthase transmembrane domain-containing protein [bacterium]
MLSNVKNNPTLIRIQRLKKYSFLIGFLLLIFVIYKLDLNIIYLSFQKINYRLLIPAIFLIIPIIFIKSWRWNYLKKLQKINYKLRDSFLIYSIGSAIGSLTPGRLGEISRIIYLKNDGYSTGQSLVSVIMDRLLDLFFLIIFGYFGIIFLFGFFEKITFVFSIVVLTIIILSFIAKKQFVHKFIKKIFSILIPFKYQKSWQINFQDFLKEVKIYNKKNYFYLLLITFLAWSVYYCQIYLFAKSINIDNVPFFYLAMTVTVAGFVTLLPISFSGIGTRETTLAILLSPLMVNIELIVLLSELILLSFFSMTIMGALCWIIKPISLTKIFSNKITKKS